MVSLGFRCVAVLLWIRCARKKKDLQRHIFVILDSESIFLMNKLWMNILCFGTFEIHILLYSTCSFSVRSSKYNLIFAISMPYQRNGIPNAIRKSSWIEFHGEIVCMEALQSNAKSRIGDRQQLFRRIFIIHWIYLFHLIEIK